MGQCYNRWHALRRGCLQNLQRLQLIRCTANDEEIRDFTYALEGSDCATRMVSLCFVNCGMGFEAVYAMAELLGRDALPALKTLWFADCPGITDEGVVVLAKALSKAPQTRLEELSLMDVGMGDKGMIALASVIYQGRLEQLVDLSISGYSGVSDRGFIVLARAIEMRGLPLIRSFDLHGLKANNMTVVGMAPSHTPSLENARIFNAFI